MDKAKACIYKVNVGEEVHSILETSEIVLEENASFENSSSTFNLVMIDVSGSMSSYWDPLMKYWNEYLSCLLTERQTTKIFVFGSDVYFRRSNTYLIKEDFLAESTNLTEAILKINTEIFSAKQSFIRLFLLTDGCHNATEISPSVEIEKLSVPSGKSVEVYLLGFGNGFPVEYSITIRSALHNSNSNIPSLFWAKCENYEENEIETDILQEIESISTIIKKGNLKVTIEPPGKLAPGFPDITVIHLGEFIYFPLLPDSLPLKVYSENGNPIDLQFDVKEADMHFLLNKVFRQWNSIIIQHHRQKKEIFNAPFEVMESIYKYSVEHLHQELKTKFANTNSIKYRLDKKEIKYIETEYATLMNQSKSIIGLENHYMSEIELAENILKTTVKSKHDTKNLKMKGHGFDDYKTDMKIFKELLEKMNEVIMNIPDPVPDECCRVTMGSMIKDLKDPSLPELLDEDKFTFMKTFTVTGLPIFAPVKSFSQINPWTLCIEQILRSPYTIISQSTLELSAEFSISSSSTEDKEIYLQQGDENSKFNAIVPVLTPETAEVLKPLIRTNIFAMVSTFCILKNPHIIDHNAHIAALSCIWIKNITEHKKNNRLEYVSQTLELICATAKIYLDRVGIAKYFEVLVSDPVEALMTESSKPYIEDKKIKCESLIKPMFLIYLNRHKIESSFIENVIPPLILEFIGRCLTKYKTESNACCIYSLLFIPEINNIKKREEYFEKKCEEYCPLIFESFMKEKGNLLGVFFTSEDLLNSVKEFFKKYMKTIENSLFNIKVNLNLINNLKNVTSAGNIYLSAIKDFLIELEMPEMEVNSYFVEKRIFVYVLHCLQNMSSSKDRMIKPLPSYDEAFTMVTKSIEKENRRYLEIRTMKAVISAVEAQWKKEYFEIHSNEVVDPMTKHKILLDAQRKGVQVNEENFNEIFRYNPKSKLLRNACMLKNCPFYLIPNKSFNQHISIERKIEFPHQLHRICRKIATANGDSSEVISCILNEKYESKNGLKIPPTPSEEYLNSIKPKIDYLIHQYRSLM